VFLGAISISRLIHVCDKWLDQPSLHWTEEQVPAKEGNSLPSISRTDDNPTQKLYFFVLLISLTSSFFLRLLLLLRLFSMWLTCAFDLRNRVSLVFFRLLRLLLLSRFSPSPFFHYSSSSFLLSTGIRFLCRSKSFHAGVRHAFSTTRCTWSEEIWACNLKCYLSTNLSSLLSVFHQISIYLRLSN